MLLLDWSDEQFSRAVTIALLQQDFQIVLDLPPSFLCPALPSRLNYLCWLQQLISRANNCDSNSEIVANSFNGANGCDRNAHSNSGTRNSYEITERHIGEEGNKDGAISGSNSVIVLDIGVGASCIYPLLGNRLYRFHFIGSDINEEAVAFANTTVTSNNLSDSVQIVCAQDSAVLQKAIVEYSNNNDESSSCRSKSISATVSSKCVGLFPKNGRYSIHQDLASKVMHEKVKDSRTSTRTNTDFETLFSVGGPIVQLLAKTDKFRAIAMDILSGYIDFLSSNSYTNVLSWEINSRFNSLIAATMTNPPFYDMDEMVSY